jgi:hypothetical protein
MTRKETRADIDKQTGMHLQRISDRLFVCISNTCSSTPRCTVDNLCIKVISYSFIYLSLDISWSLQTTACNEFHSLVLHRVFLEVVSWDLAFPLRMLRSCFVIKHFGL